MSTPFYYLSFLFLLSATLTLSAQDPKTTVTLPDWNVNPSELTHLNSPQRDINLSITPNGRYLYFMTGRGLQPWSRANYTTFRGRPEADGDIWYSEKKNGVWQAPVCLQTPVNTGMGEDEPNISADGQTVYFQSWRSNWGASGGPYYRAELRGDVWENPKGLGGGINEFFRKTTYATDGMAIAPNGRVMVVACGPDYDGPMDLYISRKGDDGAWSAPLKLDFSTPKDERSAFIAADNKTLYFASDGHGGFGNLDIFKTTLEGGARTGELVNIGRPFNTAGDDYGFLLDAPRNDVYFVREGDIWYANLGTEADERIRPEAVVVINGVVHEKTLNRSLEANLLLRDDATDQIVSQARSNALTGEYSLTLPKVPGGYTLRVNFPDGRPSIEKEIIIDENTGETLDIPVDAAPTDAELTPKSTLPKQAATILFPFDQATLTETGRQELLTLAEAVKQAGNYTLTVTGHTDDTGAAAYNQGLSERRAKAVADFLTAQGLTVKTTAKGETAPVAGNDTKENKARNRRVEVE